MIKQAEAAIHKNQKIDLMTKWDHEIQLKEEDEYRTSSQGVVKARLLRRAQWLVLSREEHLCFICMGMCIAKEKDLP